jgi:hypothetical protein
MIRDISLNFDTALVVAATATSTNTIDLGAARDLGNTANATVSCIVAATFVGGTSLQVAMQGSPDNVNWQTLLTGAAIPVAELEQGTQIANFNVPDDAPVGSAPYRYLRLDYIVVGAMTAGAVTSDVVMQKQSAFGYPSGYSYTPPVTPDFVPG